MSKPEFKIGQRLVGYNYEPLVLAEIGINHEGSLSVAFEMVDAAIAAGAEVIKHQTHVVEDEMSKEAKSVIPGNADVSIYEIMERCALNEKGERCLKEYVEKKGAIFISTPFSRAAADRLERMQVQAYKIGSGECNNYPLIEHVSRFGKPIILSTGMNDMESIKRAVEIFRRYKVPFALLHCTNVYPTPDNLVRLEAMRELQVAFPDAVVGLSDHTIGNLACLGAVALGAAILERHFTDRFDRPGPDIICSMDPAQLSALISDTRRLTLMRGGSKGPLTEERPTIDFAFASVVALVDIAKGEAFTRENLWVRRPGTGDFLAVDYESLIGKIAAKNIIAGSQLLEEDVEG